MNKVVFFALLLLASCARDRGDNAQQFSYEPDFTALAIDAQRLGRVDSLLQEYVDKGIVPHALTFVAKEGQVVHHKAFGWRDVEKQIPLEKDDLFRMYSQTKAVTTVALMTLFEQGKFQLDDPVAWYIPGMTNRVVDKQGGEEGTRPAAGPVLIRHLLSHSAGINTSGVNQREYDSLEEMVKAIVQKPLLYDPGSGWNYHPSADVWGYLVEYFSGKPLREYVREAVLEPLGIKDMDYYHDPALASRFVTIYRERDGKITPAPEMWSGRYPFDNDQQFAQGGTGLNGTIEGYARFCQMILNGGEFNGHRVLGRRTLEIMAKDQLAPAAGGNNFHFGIGFQVYPGESNRWNSPRGASPLVSPGALSWGGMGNTDYIIDPVEKMVIILYTNRVPDTMLWEKFLNTVYQALE
ncbi:MAG: beta-lactamase family protein [Odoribacteraceae bacterium]|jgi:CubicO group peptidase (beta-lactamase class C family)|nr:beta-lactamase family protein [Odoribacteraceae bacterium]